MMRVENMVVKSTGILLNTTKASVCILRGIGKTQPTFVPCCFSKEKKQNRFLRKIVRIL